MQGEDKVACFSEISHKVLDSGGKVTISSIGKSWNLNSTDSSTVLTQWEKECKSTELKKTYLVKGIDNAGVSRLTVISEDKLDAFRKNYKQFHEILYSIELASQCNSLDTEDLNDDAHIQLKIEHVERKVEGVSHKVSPQNVKPPIKEIKKEVITKQSPIQSNGKLNGSASNKDKKNSMASMFANTKPKSLDEKHKLVTPKKEKPSPQKSLKTPPKSAKNDKTKSSKVVKNNSIASFFGAKPVQRTILHKTEELVAEDTVMIEEKLKKEHIEETPDNQTKSSMKRPAESSDSENNAKPEKNGNLHSRKKSKQAKAKETHSKEDNPEGEIEKVPDNKTKSSIKRPAVSSESEEDAAKPENNENLNPRTKSKQAKAKKMRCKGSRIMQISDSSDEDEANTKKVTEETIEIDDSTPPEMKIEGTTKKRMKATRTVTKTYEEDGYLRTVKETEEYSASEEEKSPVKLTTAKAKAVTPQKNNAKKQKDCKKQGSITSFFNKK